MFKPLLLWRKHYGIFSNPFKSSFESWIETASDEELADGYEERRQQWIKDGFGGNGEKSPDANRWDKD